MSLPIEIRARKSVPVLAGTILFTLAGLILGYALCWYRGENELYETFLAQMLLFVSPALFLAVFRVRLTSWLERLARFFLLPLSAFGCLYIWEFINEYNLFRLSVPMILLNYAIILLPFLAFYALWGDIRRSVPLAFTVVVVAGYAYHCVMLFRGTPLMPDELTTISTALNMAGHYRYPFNRLHYQLLALCLDLWFFGGMLPKRSALRPSAILRRLLALAVPCVSGFVLVYTNTVQQLGVSMSQWPADTPTVLYECGTLAHFAVHLYGTQRPRPAGYDPGALEETILSAPEPKSLLAQELDSKPNIIVIMNESFADLNDALGVTTDVDPMPFIHNLTENAIKGDLFVAVRGGGTCNTEYEFLTGNALYPNTSSVPYYQIVKEPMPSLAHLLKAQGYETIAIHTAEGRNYNRDRIYPDLGFDTFYDITAFQGAEMFRPNYEYVSDRACYDRIKALYTEKDEDERLFIFNVTIQNHSPYGEGYTQPGVSVTQRVEDEEMLNEYLRCVQESDQAFSELVAYFSAQEEPTIILFFGDHHPRVTFSGEPGEMAEKSQTKLALSNYVVPYVIWANYDIVPTDIPEISANYLSSVLLSCTNVSMSPYEAYLLDVMQRYPVLTRLGYTDAQGKYTPFSFMPAMDADLTTLYSAAYNRSYDSAKRLSLWDQPVVSAR